MIQDNNEPSKLSRGRRLIELLDTEPTNGRGPIPQQIRRLAYRFLRDSADADDVRQDVYLTLLNGGLDEYDESKDFAPWVLTVTANRCRDIMRRRRRIIFCSIEAQPYKDADNLPFLLPYDNTPPEARVQLEEELSILREEMSHLAEPYKTTMRLRYLEGRSIGEIRTETNSKAGTVKNRLRSGRSSIRRAAAEHSIC